MSLLSDILKDIPLSTVLREKIVAIETKNAELETEIAILKDDLSEAREENHRLKYENQQLTHKAIPLDESKNRILVLLTKHVSLPVPEIQEALAMELIHLEYHLHELLSKKYIANTKPTIRRAVYVLTPKGRKYLVESELV